MFFNYRNNVVQNKHIWFFIWQMAVKQDKLEKWAQNVLSQVVNIMS